MAAGGVVTKSFGLLALLGACLGATSALAQRAEGDDESPAPPALRDWLEKIDVTAFVDVYGALNPNLPPDGESFFPGVGSTAKGANTFGLNLAGVDLALEPAPVGARLQLIVGSASALIHAGEPVGTVFGAEVYAPIYQAYVTLQLPFVEGLVVDAGVYASHIGFESFFSQDNWAYTRGWLAELSPYYQTGVRATYTLPALPALSVQLHVVNGWQNIVDDNLGKSVGAQLAWRTERLSVALNGWAGPEQMGADEGIRWLGDAVLVVSPLDGLSLAGSADLGVERLSTGDVSWWGAALHARGAPVDGLALAARVEYVDDPFGAISGIPQTLEEGTLTLELLPNERLVVKLEGRYDVSSAEVFAARGPDRAPAFTHTQALFVLGVVGKL